MALIDDIRAKYAAKLADKSDAFIVDALTRASGEPQALVARDLGLDPKKYTQNTGALGDLGTSLTKGAINLVTEAAPALLDAVNPYTYIAGAAPATYAAEKLAELTGISGDAAEERLNLTYSPEYQEIRREGDQVWEEGTPGEIAGYVARNALPLAGNLVAESIPGLAAGGVVGRGVRALGGLARTPAIRETVQRAAPFIGEGAVMTGYQTGELLNQGVDPRAAGGLGVATGAVGGVIGAGGARLANRLGVIDPEQAVAGVGRAAVERPLGYVPNLAVGTGIEAGEEVLQSGMEQTLQNVGTQRNLLEGVPRAMVEGGLAGGAMGAGFNAIPRFNQSYLPEETGLTGQDRVDLLDERLRPAVDAYTGVNVRMPEPLNEKQLAQRQAQFLEAYNEPSDIRVIDPETQLERQLTVGEAYEYRTTGKVPLPQPKAQAVPKAKRLNPDTPLDNPLAEWARGNFKNTHPNKFTKKGLLHRSVAKEAELVSQMTAEQINEDMAKTLPVWKADLRQQRLRELIGDANAQPSATATPSAAASQPPTGTAQEPAAPAVDAAQGSIVDADAQPPAAPVVPAAQRVSPEEAAAFNPPTQDTPPQLPQAQESAQAPAVQRTTEDLVAAVRQAVPVAKIHKNAIAGKEAELESELINFTLSRYGVSGTGTGAVKGQKGNSLRTKAKEWKQRGLTDVSYETINQRVKEVERALAANEDLKQAYLSGAFEKQTFVDTNEETQTDDDFIATATGEVGQAVDYGQDAEQLQQRMGAEGQFGAIGTESGSSAVSPKLRKQAAEIWADDDFDRLSTTAQEDVAEIVRVFSEAGFTPDQVANEVARRKEDMRAIRDNVPETTQDQEQLAKVNSAIGAHRENRARERWTQFSGRMKRLPAWEAMADTDRDTWIEVVSQIEDSSAPTSTKIRQYNEVLKALAKDLYESVAEIDRTARDRATSGGSAPRRAAALSAPAESDGNDSGRTVSDPEPAPTSQEDFKQRAANVKVATKPKKRRIQRRTNVDRFEVENPVSREGFEEAITGLLGPNPIASNRIVAYETVDDVPADLREEIDNDGSTAWVVKEGKRPPVAYFILSRMEPSEVTSVLMHEIGAHIGLETMLSDDQYRPLLMQLRRWHAAGVKGDTSLEATLAMRAMKQVEDLGYLDPAPDGTVKPDANLEFVAYFVEEAVAAGVDPTVLDTKTPLGRWFRQLMAGMMRALRRFFRTSEIAKGKITAQDVVNLAAGAANMAMGTQYAQIDASDLSGSVKNRYEAALKKGDPVFHRLVHAEGRTMMVEATEVDPEDFGLPPGTGPTVTLSFAELNDLTDEDAEVEDVYDPFLELRYPRQALRHIMNAAFDVAGDAAMDGRTVIFQGFDERRDRIYKKALDRNQIEYRTLYSGGRLDELEAKLGVDFNDPEQRQAVFDRYDAILDKRAADPDGLTDYITRSFVITLDQVGQFVMREPGTIQFSKQRPQTINNLSDGIDATLAAAKNGLPGNLMGWLTMDQLAKRFGGAYPAMTKLMKSFGSMEAKAKHWQTAAERIDRDWAQLDKGRKQLLDQIMSQATLLGFDPETKQQTATKPEEHELNRLWKRLEQADRRAGKNGPKGTVVYKHARDHFVEDLNAAKEHVKSIDKDSASPRVKQLIDILDQLTRQGKKPYFPMMRLGGFYTVGMSREMQALMKKVDNETATEAELRQYRDWRLDPKHYVTTGHRSRIAAEFHKRQLEKRGLTAYANQGMYRPNTNSEVLLPEIEKFDQLLSDLNMPATMATKFKEQYEAMLVQALPEQHPLKRALRREGIREDDPNMREKFAAAAQTRAYTLSRLIHAREIQEAMGELNAASGEGENEARALSREMAQRAELAYTRTEDPTWVRMLTKASYMGYLGASPAFFLLNLTQTPVIAAPWLAARNGNKMPQTMTSLMKNMVRIKKAIQVKKAGEGVKELFVEFDTESKQFTAQERKVLQALQDSGILDFTIGYDLAAVAEGRNTALEQMTRSLNVPTNVIEIMNRAATALTAYEIKSRTASHQAALDFAQEAVSTTQVNYSPANAARLMQKLPILDKSGARIVFQFYRFQQAMAYLAISTFKDAFMGADAQTRKEARATMAWMTASLTATSGVFGLPFASGALSVASAVWSALGADDDEDVDFERDLKNLAKDTMPWASEYIIRGLVDPLTGASLGKRAGQGDLLNPFGFSRVSGRNPTSEDYAKEGLFALAGAPVSNAVEMWDGVLTLVNGALSLDGNEIREGFEKAVPLKLIRDAAKAAELTTEGMTQRDGDVIFKPGQFSALEVLYRGIGLTPLKQTKYYEQNAAVQGKREAVETAKSKLMAEARQATSYRERAKIRRKIRDFNIRNPHTRITAASLRLSQKADQQRRRYLGPDGVDRSPQNRPYLDAGRYAQ